ncbi:MAG: hypothetical protein P8J25_06805 [Porticoccaceae bacterium]|nr:hypothetical protein [Porticoccaceae bacterium]
MNLSNITMAEITHFLGWCTLINLVILAVTTVAIVCFKSAMNSFYSRLLKLEANQVSDLFFRFLVHYEVAVLVLNIVPYTALKIIS